MFARTDPPDPSAAPKPPIIALFNHGGGMRGLITAHFMQKIEDATGLHISDMVDIFMGPSTGSILNAALNVPNPYDPTKPKFKARHMVRFYEREGIHIFPRDSFRAFRSMIHDFNNRTVQIEQLGNLLKHGHYEHASLGRSLRALYGRNKLSDSLKSLIVPVYNIDSTNDFPHARTGSHAVWLKNLKVEGAVGAPPCPEVDLFDAVMASTAAPTYFPCHRFPVRVTPDAKDSLITGIDGSMFDNPCVSYFGALKPHIPPDRELIMIVLGTGQTNISITRDTWNRFGALGVVDPKHNMPLINFFFYASETALFESFGQSLGDNLFVFNKSLVSGPYREDFPAPDIDDASPENVRRMKNFFEMMLEENRSRFDQMCDILVRNYERKHVEEQTPPQSTPKPTLGRGLFRKKKPAQ